MRRCVRGVALAAASVVVLAGCGHKPAEHARAPAAAVNDVCPVSGRPASSEHYVLHEGKVIRFSDRQSMMEFRKNPEKYSARLRERPAQP